LVLLLAASFTEARDPDQCKDCYPHVVLPGAEGRCQSNSTVIGSCRPNENPKCTFVGGPQCPKECASIPKLGYNLYCDDALRAPIYRYRLRQDPDQCKDCYPHEVAAGVEDRCKNDPSVSTFGACKSKKCTFVGGPQCPSECASIPKLGYNVYCPAVLRNPLWNVRKQKSGKN
jgi:hypothetical protein